MSKKRFKRKVIFSYLNGGYVEAGVIVRNSKFAVQELNQPEKECWAFSGKTKEGALADLVLLLAEILEAEKNIADKNKKILHKIRNTLDD